MANKLYEENDIQAIANAIRTKAGTQGTMTVSQMATNIANIPSSGSAYSLAFDVNSVDINVHSEGVYVYLTISPYSAEVADSILFGLSQPDVVAMSYTWQQQQQRWEIEISPIAEGMTDLIAVSTDGSNIGISCPINVDAEPEVFLSFDEDPIRIYNGETKTIYLSVTGMDGTLFGDEVVVTAGENGVFEITNYVYDSDTEKIEITISGISSGSDDIYAEIPEHDSIFTSATVYVGGIQLPNDD